MEMGHTMGHKKHVFQLLPVPVTFTDLEQRPLREHQLPHIC